MSAVAHIDQYKTGRFYSDEFRGDFSWNGYEHNVLLRSDGVGSGTGLHFTDIAMAVGVDDVFDARGVATADFDNDGDLDIAINHNAGDHDTPVTPVLLRNNVGSRRSWLAVELRGTKSNHDAVGALVRVTTAHGDQVRHVNVGSAYASQQTTRLYFGLADAAQVEQLWVRWPSGLEETFDDLGARQLVRITEAGGMEELSLPKRRTASMAETSNAGSRD